MKCKHQFYSNSLLTKVKTSLASAFSQDQVKDCERLLLQSGLNSVNEGVIFCDEQRKILQINPAFTNITGYCSRDVVGKDPRILSSGRHDAIFYKEIWSVVNNDGEWEGEIWNKKKNGETYIQSLKISAIQDNGIIKYYIGIFSDLTSGKEQERALAMMANYDSLSGLPNRALFTDRFNLARSRSSREHSLLSLASIDLDNFKPINDLYGHEVGDAILIEAANRIKHCVRDDDTVCRTGGDEFLLLLGSLYTSEEVASVLERIHKSLALPFEVGDEVISISGSSGYTVYPFDNEDLDLLIRHADQAMHKAKLCGKGNFSIYNPDEDKEAMEKSNRLETIAAAFVNNEFELYYQPKLNMKTGFVYGAEALIRWNHPEKGVQAPIEFLPFIENTELEVAVGNWVISQALDQISAWQKLNINLEVSVNISSFHLQTEDFVETVRVSLAKHPAVDSRSLQLEILESSVLSDLAMVTNTISACRHDLGVHVALDDFGTGYSSLTHLRRLPVNAIKIDRSFVSDILDDPSDYAIIDGTISLSKAFHREVIAEGVETVEQGMMLILLGCENGQGFGIAKPMPSRSFYDWITNYVPNERWKKCALTTGSHKDVMIKLIKLLDRHWYAFFTGAEKPEKWPITAFNKGHAEFWINQARQFNLFDHDWLEKFEDLHREMYLTGHLISTLNEANSAQKNQHYVRLEKIHSEIEKLMMDT